VAFKCSNHAREHARQAYQTLKLTQPKTLLIYRSKASAKRRGVPFTIKQDDLEDIPATCPVLGIPIVFGEGGKGPNSPSLDRVNNAFGYIPGNVRIISNRANSLKSDMSLTQVEQLLRYMRREI